MRILVTGGAGFIGSHIVDKYINLGHEVAIIDNLSTGFEVNLNPKAKFYKEDIANLKKIEEIFKKFNPEVVNHHAALAEVVKSLRDPTKTLGVNVLGTANLLLSGGKSGIKKFIFSSTGGAIYGDPKNPPVDEDCKAEPLSPYGLSKLLGEKTIEFYANTYGFGYVIFRYSNVYGPRQNPKGEAGVVAIFSDLIKSGEKPKIFGDGSKTRDYVYVSDIVNANEIALGVESNQIFNLGWGVEVSDKQIFDEIASTLNFKEDPIYADFRKGEVNRISLDASKAKNLIGWEPKIKLSQGVEATVTKP